MDRHGEGQAQEHPGGVVLDLGVDELLDFAELDDLVEAVLDLLLRKAQHHAVDEDVLAAGDLGVEAGADLDESGHSTTREGGARVGLEHSGDQLEHGGFEHGVCVGQIQAKAGLTQSTVSEYLSILQRAGFIEAKRVGQWTYYKRNEGAFEALSKLIQSNL